MRQQGEDLTGWLDYCAEGLLLKLERVWTRVQKFAAKPKQKNLVLRPPADKSTRHESQVRSLPEGNRIPAWNLPEGPSLAR
jgi:hypothetical protein